MSESLRPSLYRSLLNRVLRRVEVLQDMLAEEHETPDIPYLVEALAEIRGILATVLQWEIERGGYAAQIGDKDIPF